MNHCRHVWHDPIWLGMKLAPSHHRSHWILGLHSVSGVNLWSCYIMLYHVCSDVGNRTERDVLGLSQRCLAFVQRCRRCARFADIWMFAEVLGCGPITTKWMARKILLRTSQGADATNRSTAAPWRNTLAPTILRCSLKARVLTRAHMWA